MKRPCAWCGVRPAVYSGTEYCSYQCEYHSMVATGTLSVQEEDPEPQDSKQLDLFEKLLQVKPSS